MKVTEKIVRKIKWKFEDSYSFEEIGDLKILKCGSVVEIHLVEGFVCNSRSWWFAECWISGTVVVYEPCLNKNLNMTYGSTVVWLLQWLLFLGMFAKLQ